MAAICLPALAKAVTCSVRRWQASRWMVPGMPPGRISISYSSKSSRLTVVSVRKVTSWDEVTDRLSEMETLVRGIPAL